VAHFKEWIGLTIHGWRHDHNLSLHNNNDDDTIIYHNDTQSLTSASANDAGINFKSHTVEGAGMVTLYHDGDKLHDWFQFVARRGAVVTSHQQEEEQQQ
jgi:hypothetical protein